MTGMRLPLRRIPERCSTSTRQVPLEWQLLGVSGRGRATLADLGATSGVAMVRMSRCACGACRVEVEGEPTSNGLCSCDNCKRRTGAPFGWSVYFRDEQVGRIEGPLTALVGRGKRWFCSTCGSTLYLEVFRGLEARRERLRRRLLRRSDVAAAVHCGAVCAGNALGRLPRRLRPLRRHAAERFGPPAVRSAIIGRQGSPTVQPVKTSYLDPLCRCTSPHTAPWL